jgi:hypothetical protein
MSLYGTLELLGIDPNTLQVTLNSKGKGVFIEQGRELEIDKFILLKLKQKTKPEFLNNFIEAKPITSVISLDLLDAISNRPKFDASKESEKAYLVSQALKKQLASQYTPPPNRLTPGKAQKPSKFTVRENTINAIQKDFSNHTHSIFPSDIATTHKPKIFMLSNLTTDALIDVFKNPISSITPIKIIHNKKEYGNYQALLVLLNSRNDLTLTNVTEVVTNIKKNGGDLGAAGLELISNNLRKFYTKILSLDDKNDAEEIKSLKEEFKQNSLLLKKRLTKNGKNPHIAKRPSAQNALDTLLIIEKYFDDPSPKQQYSDSLQNQPSQPQNPPVSSRTPSAKSSSIASFMFSHRKKALENLNKLTSNHITAVTSASNKPAIIDTNKHFLEKVTKSETNIPSSLYNDVEIIPKNDFSAMKINIPDPNIPGRVDTLNQTYENGKMVVRMTSPLSDKAIFIMLDFSRNSPPLTLTNSNTPEITLKILEASKLSNTPVVLDKHYEELLKNEPYKERYEALNNMDIGAQMRFREYVAQNPDRKLGDPLPKLEVDNIISSNQNLRR